MKFKPPGLLGCLKLSEENLPPWAFGGFGQASRVWGFLFAAYFLAELGRMFNFAPLPIKFRGVAQPGSVPRRVGEVAG